MLPLLLIETKDVESLMVPLSFGLRLDLCLPDRKRPVAADDWQRDSAGLLVPSIRSVMEKG